MSSSGPHPFRFPKKERLTSKKDIEGLFKNGSSFYLHPIMLKYLPGQRQHQVLITVSKKHFKKAVARNQIKRRMREAYRLNKSIIEELEVFYQLGFVYVGKSIVPYQEIAEKLKTLLQRLKNQASKS